MAAGLPPPALPSLYDTPEHFMDDLKKYGYIKG